MIKFYLLWVLVAVQVFDKTIIVDLDGAIKTIEASKQANVKHYIMVSTYDARREAFDPSGDLKPYTIAKHYVDEHLKILD